MPLSRRAGSHPKRRKTQRQPPGARGVGRQVGLNLVARIGFRPGVCGNVCGKQHWVGTREHGGTDAQRGRGVVGAVRGQSGNPYRGIRSYPATRASELEDVHDERALRARFSRLEPSAVPRSGQGLALCREPVRCNAHATSTILDRFRCAEPLNSRRPLTTPRDLPQPLVTIGITLTSRHHAARRVRFLLHGSSLIV